MTNTTAPATRTNDDSNVEALREQANAQFGIYSAGIIRHEQDAKDWTYLADKEPQSNHYLQAKMITELSGVEISPKQCMALLAMHRWIQKSEANQQREGFHGRTVDSVLKGSATLAERVSTRPGTDLVEARIPVTIEQAEAQAALDAATEAEAPAPKPARKPRAPRKSAAEQPATGEF